LSYTAEAVAGFEPATEVTLVFTTGKIHAESILSVSARSIRTSPCTRLSSNP
jgi:hypothetical protein